MGRRNCRLPCGRKERMPRRASTETQEGESQEPNSAHEQGTSRKQGNGDGDGTLPQRDGHVGEWTEMK